MSLPAPEKEFIKNEIVNPDDSDKNSGLRIEETPAERRFRWVFTAGLWILGAVGLAMIASTVVYAWQYVDIVGQRPNIPSNTPQTDIKAILENYKTLSDIRLNAAQSFFDNTVVKVFLPIFTTVLGVVLGIRIGESSTPED
jgi:ABC-type sugar transport system permease subunit